MPAKLTRRASRWVRGAELKQEAQHIEELQRGFHLGRRHRRDPGNGGRGGRSWFAEEGGERLRFVLGLDLLDVVEVGGVEELGAADDVDELGLRPEDFGDAGGDGTFPSRAGDEKRAAAVAGCAGAEVVEIEGVKVHHLEDPIAVLLDGRDGEDDGLGAEVET